MTHRWKRKRPIPSNTRTVTINPAQTMTNSRLRTAMTNIQSPLSRSRGRGRVPAEQFVVAHVGLEPERKGIAQPRNYPDQLVDQDIHCHASEQNFRNSASLC